MRVVDNDGGGSAVSTQSHTGFHLDSTTHNQQPPPAPKTVSTSFSLAHEATETVGFQDVLSILILAWALCHPDEESLTWQLMTTSGATKTCSLSRQVALPSIEVSVSQALADVKSHQSISETGRILFSWALGGDVNQTTLEADASEHNHEIVVTARASPSVKHSSQDAQTALESFAKILRRILGQPEKRLDEVAEPSTKDLDQLWAWNQHMPPLLQTCMHDLFLAQAQRQPDALAVQSWDGSLTYAELDRLSARLARHLMAKGIGIGTRVPLCFEKSMWAVVSLLGIMRAGATFSLTDPSQPEARLRTIVEQTGATTVVTSAAQSELGRRIAGEGEVVAVSADFFEAIGDGDVGVALPIVPPSTPMYIIFTSGSTGKPKGVVISHENYTSGAVPRAAAVGYVASSRVFDFPSYAFDVSIDCMLCTLSVGGRICVPSEAARVNDLSGAIRSSGANMVHMTPSVARVLDADIMPSLDVLGLGGEAVSPSDAAAWSCHTSLVIAYGPSECTVGCTINNTVTVSTGIGVGVGGVTWIVDPDDHDHLLPVGAVGELLIEGPVVGLGYLDEPEKTAQVFIDDPAWLVAGHDRRAGSGLGLGPIPGRRGTLYKTGDLVRYEPGLRGSIEFVGRKDQQVKLRGQRVELAEVEHHLRACLPAHVKAAAEVVKPDDGGGPPTLVAFLCESSDYWSSSDSESDELTVTPSPELATAIATIDSTMGARVPRYMVPAAFITLHDMPTLVSRKTDRKKLREIGKAIPREKLSRMRQQQQGLDTEAPEEAPETDLEKRLARAWAKVLMLSHQGENETPIHRQSSFFFLGGDSLRAMKLISAAREEGLALTVADVFTSPVLGDMAARSTRIDDTVLSNDVPSFSLLDAGWTPDQATRDVAALCGVDSEAVEDVYPCTPLQEALMALSAKVKEAYVAQRVVSLDSQATAQRLLAAFDEAHQSSPILRTRIVQVPGRGLMQVVVRGKLAWRADTNLSAYLGSDRDEPMDLGRPLVRYAVVDEGNDKVNFVLTMHHALYDGWSMPLIVDRVNRAYVGEPMGPRPAEFKHFLQYLGTQDRTISETFWRGRLQGAGGAQFPAIPHEGFQTKADSLLEVYVPLSSEPQSSSNVTVATIIRAAWALVASQYVGADDVVLGETLTGRNAPIVGADEIEGPMITTVPLRIRIDRGLRAADFLRELQDLTVAQIPHEHFGLQHIRRLSADALDACELRTGLVLHPSSSPEDADTQSQKLPADRLVPAGDAEAAQEALKFNTYALMLVCSIDPAGFLVMASFDSRTVTSALMQRALAQFQHVAQQLWTNPGLILSDVSCLGSSEVAELHDLAREAAATANDVLSDYQGVTAAYVVDASNTDSLLPVEGVGHILLCSSADLPLEELPAPAWAIQESGHMPALQNRFYKTDKLGKFSLADRRLVITGPLPPNNPARLATGEQQQGTATKYVSATSRRQRRLRSLWARVLQVPAEDQIGLNDNFFALGGDSIAAMKLVSEARAEGISLSVMQVFDNRSLYDMANVMEEEYEQAQATGTAAPVEDAAPFSLLDVDKSETATFVEGVVRPKLGNPQWAIANILPARPLQHVAVRGTTQLPRFSCRYELAYLDGAVDVVRMKRACAALVQNNEILRTVFVEHEERCYGVVVDDLEAEFVEYTIDGDDVAGFARQLCRLDVMTSMPLGSIFVKWLLVTNSSSSSACLIFRISHAQYDEMCLPHMLRQLSALYQGREPQPSVPFSAYVAHVLRTSVPQSLPYWRELLAGSSLSVLRPDVPLTRTNHFAIEASIDISSRPRDTTVATLPTAAWALCLARRLGVRDVVFGEVVSGRTITGFPAAADAVAGPCWQYVPVRVRFDDAAWTAHDLLAHVQRQHVASAAHEAVGLPEVVANCTDWPVDPQAAWFDTVVHQDVEHVEDLGLDAVASRMETIYPHEEPLREWKIQAFVAGEKLTLEIVTFDSWADYARGLLDDLVAATRQLVEEPQVCLFPDAQTSVI